MLDLSKVKLTESLLQICYQSKTYVRNNEWDILWYLGGKNKVTIGEKSGNFYLLPGEVIETVTELLPFELVQAQHIKGTECPRRITHVGELKIVYPEIDTYIPKYTYII